MFSCKLSIHCEADQYCICIITFVILKHLYCDQLYLALGRKIFKEVFTKKGEQENYLKNIYPILHPM